MEIQNKCFTMGKGLPPRYVAGNPSSSTPNPPPFNPQWGSRTFQHIQVTQFIQQGLLDRKRPGNVPVGGFGLREFFDLIKSTEEDPFRSERRVKSGLTSSLSYYVTGSVDSCSVALNSASHCWNEKASVTSEPVCLLKLKLSFMFCQSWATALITHCSKTRLPTDLFQCALQFIFSDKIRVTCRIDRWFLVWFDGFECILLTNILSLPII